VRGGVGGMTRGCPNCGVVVPVFPGLRSFTVAHARTHSVNPRRPFESDALVVQLDALLFVSLCRPTVSVGLSRDIPAPHREEAWSDDSLWEGL
jgi:hypothetical protein